MSIEIACLDARNPGAMTGSGNNTYLVAGVDGSGVLVDAGVGDPRHLADLARELRRLRATLTDVVVTHGHADHASGAPAIRAAQPGARFSKYPWPDEDARYAVPWHTIEDGEMVRVGAEALVVLRTPGHAPDHIVLWHEPTRTAFTGDLVILGGSVMIHTSRGGDLREYLASLERVRALGARRLMPAHGPAIEDPEGVLTAYLDHRALRERQVVAALGSGLATVQAIAESIYDGLDPALMPAARENVRAHLDKLKAEGRAAEEGGCWRT